MMRPTFPHKQLLIQGSLFLLASMVFSHVFFSHVHVYAEGPVPLQAAASTTVDESAVNLQVEHIRAESHQLFQDLQTNGQNTQRIRLYEVIQRTLEHGVVIQVAKEKKRASEIKRRDVSAKTLLYMLRFVNPVYLQTAAMNDVKATEAELNLVTYESLLQSTQGYFTLMRAYMARYAALQSIQEALSTYDVALSDFQSGEQNSFPLHKAAQQVFEKQAQFLKADTLYQGASAQLAALLMVDTPLQLTPEKGKTKQAKNNMKGTIIPPFPTSGLPLLYPSELSVQTPEQGVSVPEFALLDPELTLETALKEASAKRPDLAALRYRIEALSDTKKAGGFGFGNVEPQIIESTRKQLAQQHLGLMSQIRASVQHAFQSYQSEQDALKLSEEALQVAEKALRQMKVSYEAGFSSRLDLLNTKAALAKVQVAHANKQLDYNFSQVQLLYEMGLISAERFDNRPAPHPTENNPTPQ